MSAFAAWGLTLLGLAVITTIAEILLPQGKTRSVIRSVSATIAALVIVTPLPALFKSGFNFDFSSEYVQTDSAYLDYVDGIKSGYLEKAVKEYLGGKGYEVLSVAVEFDGFSVTSATVNFSQTGMSEKDKHIHKSEITKLVAEYFGIGEEAVMAYG